MVIAVLNGIPFVYLFSFKIPLRPDKYWMVLQVLNNISFDTIQNTTLRSTQLPIQLDCIERDWKVSKFHKQTYHFSPQWYWTVLQVSNGMPFVVGFFTIQSTIDTNKFTFYVSNGIERYWTVLNGIEWYWMVFEWYTVGRFWWHLLLLKISLRPNKHHWH